MARGLLRRALDEVGRPNAASAAFLAGALAAEWRCLTGGLGPDGEALALAAALLCLGGAAGAALADRALRPCGPPEGGGRV